jgi:transcriptional regulator with XRE-family HTH domain
MSREPVSPTDLLARRVKESRRRLDLTAAELAERMTAAGFAWDRFTVQNLENRRRKTVSLDEVLALACVLQVAPVHLLLPLDDEDAQVSVTDERSAPAWQVREWIIGRRPPLQWKQDDRLYFSQVPSRVLAWADKAVPASLTRTETVPEGNDGER